MSTNQENNKRIMKNTLMLYIRMLFMMIISLFTSRVILNTLGVEDFGTYNVVGGVVAMFSAFSSMFTGAISRFLTFELGKKESARLNEVFSTSVTIQIGISLIFVIVAEIVGLYFVNYKLVIPAGRLFAANCVLQCSIITFVVGLISVPYNAAIIAHEKMSAFAYIGIFEVVMKLIIVYALYISPFDKLISYAILLMLLSVTIRFIYGSYCGKHFNECHYNFSYDKTLLHEMSGFAGWHFFSSGAYILNIQGVNILINMFFGVTLNAARGIANQVDNAILQLVNNFMMALKPQIIKSVASGNLTYMTELVCRGAKFGYLLMFFFFVPIYAEAEQILTIWLKIVPEYAVPFVQLAMIGSMVDLLGATISSAIIATGKVKSYCIAIGTFGLMVFPVTYICFRLGCPAEYCYYSFICVYALLLFVKLRQANKLVGFPIWTYVRDVLFRLLPVTVVVLFVTIFVKNLIVPSLSRLFIVSVVGVVTTAVMAILIVLTARERQFIINIVKSKIKR